MKCPAYIACRAERIADEQPKGRQRVISDDQNDDTAHDERGENGDQRPEDLSEDVHLQRESASTNITDNCEPCHLKKQKIDEKFLQTGLDKVSLIFYYIYGLS